MNEHTYYCKRHDNGYIICTDNKEEPERIQVCLGDCDPHEHTYLGVNFNDQKWLDMWGGGWKVSFFQQNKFKK